MTCISGSWMRPSPLLRLERLTMHAHIEASVRTRRHHLFRYGGAHKDCHPRRSKRDPITTASCLVTLDRLTRPLGERRNVILRRRLGNRVIRGHITSFRKDLFDRVSARSMSNETRHKSLRSAILCSVAAGQLRLHSNAPD